jgi:hypothetical protein
LDAECTQLISNEVKSFLTLLNQSDVEFKQLSNLSGELGRQVIEFCQLPMSVQSQAARADKIRKFLSILLKDDSIYQSNASGSGGGGGGNGNGGDAKRSFYDSCLIETCVQMCLLKPTLLSRHGDLLMYARKILENCSIVDENHSKFSNKSKR